MSTKESHFLNNGHLDDAATAFYVDALVQEDQSILAEEVLEHVEECLDCKEKILDLFMFSKNLAASQSAPAEPKVVRLKPRRRWYLYPARAAAVFFIFALALTAYFLLLDRDSSLGRYLSGIFSDREQTQVQQDQEAAHEAKGREDATVGQDEAKEPALQKERRSITPVNWRVNANLENMIGSQSRSTTVHIQSPKNGARTTGDILFSWQPVDLEPLYLKILNNRNVELFRYTLDENRFLFKERLPVGLYYWKLESTGDLLYVGKFFIQ